MRKKVFYTAGAVIFWLAVWEAAALIVNKSLLLASPFEALRRLIDIAADEKFAGTVLYSAGRILAGFLSGSAAGIVLAVLSGKFAFAEKLFSPLLTTVKAIPVASFTILALIWISSSELSLLITFLIAFPVTYSNVFEGIRSLDRELNVMADIFRIPPWRRFVGVYLSQLMPYIRSAAKLSMGLCWKSGVAAEVIGIPKGSVGERLYNSKVYLETADLFAWTAVIILLSIICEKLFLLVIDLTVKRIEKL